MLNRCVYFTPNGAPLYHPIRSSHVNSYVNYSTVQARAQSAMAAANSVRVAAAQMTSVNDIASNFATCSRLVKEAVSAGAKMLCLPENFSYVGSKSGDSLLIAEPLDGPIMQKYCSLARESGIWLSLGGFQEKGHDDAHLRNTHVIIDDAGNIRSTYSRAIETQCYVIASAQAGKHSEKRESYGETLIIDPWGTVVGRLPDRVSTGITVADIDFSLIDSVRAKMPIAKHRKPFDFWRPASL
ncbi:Nitrilase/cyanide hydratase and apolipoprotein N-acyltransferase family protein isoform 5 [Theobroma cacao]|uniref:Nitrilase/cyanide hydratase and apolipoprotein N-acyltransferase family protein isoform 5 n=1 Tax=Theobroma cacao TaxID=3641 RepID=A0A061FMY6_THECC|nr:Nitrilase/cyanide hydratase and apolipoprotein N-acyltransferase family protein isoform 5 [Theobroma cacao]